ncbi:MAG: OmpH family outer membrane protein [Chlamydiae bacterium]|nr:OmpH family outer membrane protein [Chlamydiota bacterium]
MKQLIFKATLAAAGLFLQGNAFADNGSFGIVNFSNCITDSKLGKEEQSSFENLKKQMSFQIEDIEKQIGELASKFNDPDYMDGLSPEAEDELKIKIRSLNEELNRYQNQFYQVLNQANMKIIQTLSATINTASEKVAKDKKLHMVVNKEACFFYNPNLDITNLVIAEMDKSYEHDSKKIKAQSSLGNTDHKSSEGK